MIDYLYRRRFLIARRFTQISLLFMYAGANIYGWEIARGNFSSSVLFNTIPLSDPFAVLQMFFAGAFISADILIGAFVVLAVYGIIGGRFFCSWVCPVNIITDTAAWIKKKLSFKTKEKQLTLSRSIRYWIIAVTFILSFLFSLSAFEMISPIGIAHRGIIFGFGFGWFFLLAIFLFDLFSQEHGWCGHICPLGGFNAIIGKYSLIKVIHNQEKCLYSFACFNVCPENEILRMVGKKSVVITGAECVKCGRCIEVCNNDAFEVSIVGIAKQLRDKG